MRQIVPHGPTRRIPTTAQHRHAAEHGPLSMAWMNVLHGFFVLRGHVADASATADAALAAADQAGDPPA